MIKEIPKRHPDLSVNQYNSIVKWCDNAIDQNQDFLYDISLFTKALADACTEYQIQRDSLNSLMRNTHVWHVKKTTRAVKNRMVSHAERYSRGQSIAQIAKENRYPPYLMARAMLEVLLNNQKISRKGLTEAMRNPVAKLGDPSVLAEKYFISESYPSPPVSRELLEQNPSISRLAREVLHVIEIDPMYGPTHDEARHRIGNDYEVLLVDVLKSMDVPFETEDELRKKGTSRTPDVLLSTPVAVQVPSGSDSWRIVCWIDSKALFGDARTHKDSVLSQAESYIHRFGPGLVLYWFGHAPQLDDAQGDITICGWNLPNNLLLPTGEVVVQPQSENGLEQKKEDKDSSSCISDKSGETGM
mmetsp:Transcript_27924/g.41223  ORF Transcript_27924/g.41223 Transcript_27924/m.41223 type:complete len:358 (+) Transcript_27924:140-1213(+)